MPQEKQARTPQYGEALILADGRRFVLTDAEQGIRGWWFTATAHDGRNTLQGNLRLQWDAQARAWRPDGARPVAAEPRAVVRRAPQPQERQFD